MNRTSALIGAAVLILIFIGVLFFILQSRETSLIPVTQTEQTTSGNSTVEANGASVVVMYTDAGFSPSTVTIGAGTTVTWSNQSSHALWVVDSAKTTDTCPTNTATLNECQSILSGGSYSFTAITPGTITYTNKENARDIGTITVSPVKLINPEALPQ